MRLERAGHDPGRDRSGAARAADGAPCRERGLRAGARAEHDRLRRRRMERRDRNRLRGVGRYHASRLIVLSYEPAPHAPGRARDDRRRRPIPAGRVRAAARDGRCRDRRRPPRRPRDDRRPARGHRTCRRCCGRRTDTARSPRRCSASRRRCWSTRSTSPSGARRSTAPAGCRAGLCGRSRVASLDALARAGRGAFDPPALRRELAAITSVAVRHHPESTVAALLLVGWLASRLEWQALRWCSHDRPLPGGRARAAAT